MMEDSSVVLGISNLYIEEILKSKKASNLMCVEENKKNKVTGFCGVYSSNTLPLQLIKEDQFSFICNLSRLDQKGTHFVSVIVFADFYIYIDSLGLPCMNTDVRQYLSLLNRPNFTNLNQLQDFKSSFCGFFCILFILYFEGIRLNGKKMTERIRFVWETNHDKLFLNDEKSIEYICKLLRM